MALKRDHDSWLTLERLAVLETLWLGKEDANFLDNALPANASNGLRVTPERQPLLALDKSRWNCEGG